MSLRSKTRSVWRSLSRPTLIVAALLLIALPPFIPRGNPYASVIEDAAALGDWDKDGIQMLAGQVTDVSFLRWTRVDVVVRTSSSDTPVYATVRKGPFARAYLSCHAVGTPEPCAG